MMVRVVEGPFTGAMGEEVRRGYSANAQKVCSLVMFDRKSLDRAWKASMPVCDRLLWHVSRDGRVEMQFATDWLEAA